MDQIVKAAGNDSQNAALLLIADKLLELVKLQSEAIKNIKIDKITVWEGFFLRWKNFNLKFYLWNVQNQFLLTRNIQYGRNATS